MEIILPDSVKKLAELAAFPVYVTGGYLRNQIAGLGETDIDLCGPVVATALSLPSNYYIKTVNFRLGTAIIKCGDTEFEYTPFRIENYNAGGAHSPAHIDFTPDINKDVLRRDFAANSLYYDIKNAKLIDLAGGVADCKNNILRAISPDKTFSSDGLRLMRLARIAAETGFKIEAKTAAAAAKYAQLLKDISPERKRDELEYILNADKKYGVENAHYRGLKLVHKLGLLKYIIPQLLEGDGLAQNPEYHKYDVLEHTFQSVRFADPSVRLAALLHDIGKPFCFKQFGKMHGHERVSEHMAKEILGPFGLRYPNNVVDEVSRLCKHHMYDLDGKTSENKIKLFICQNYDIIEKLALLNSADRAGSGLRPPLEFHRVLKIKEQMAQEGAPFKISELEIDGAKLIELGFVGEEIGTMLDDMLCKCIMEPRLNNEEWLVTHAKRYIERKGLSQ